MNTFTKERFGSQVPKNWEEICDYLDWFLEYFVENFAEGEDINDLADEMWSDWCAGNLYDAPEAIM